MERIQSLSAERAVLGSILLSSSAIDRVTSILKAPEYFGAPGHQQLFAVMLQIRDGGAPIDTLTVVQRLREMDVLDGISARDTNLSGVAYVASMTDMVPDIANVERYAAIVREKFVARQAAETMTSSLAQMESGKETISSVIAGSVDKLLRLGDVSGSGLVSIDKMLRQQVMPEIEHRLQTGNHFRGIRTGFPTLDAIFQGWQPEQLYLIAGYSSVGKTALGGNMILSALEAHEDLQVVMYSLEMASFALGTRFLSMESGVELELIRSALLTVEQMERITEAAARLGGYRKRLFVNTRRVAVEDIVAECRMLSKQFSSWKRLVVVDYIQLLRGRAAERNELMLRQVARGLLDLAKELHCPVITFAQLNGDEQERPPDFRPLARDLRDAKALRDDARGVLLMSRPWAHRKKSPDYRECYVKLIVDKQSEGPSSDDVHLHYDGRVQVMREAESDADCPLCQKHVGPPYPPPRPYAAKKKKKKSVAQQEVQAALAIAGMVVEEEK